MANAEEIIAAVKILDFPKNEFAVFGGACLALHGIREANDLELFVSEAVKVIQARKAGWVPRSYSGRNYHWVGLVGTLEVQIFSEWDNEGWQPSIKQYLNEPEVVRGVPCMPLDQLMEWKAQTARPKDLRDIELVARWRTQQ